MNSAPDFLVDPPSRPAPAPTAIASWYAQGVSDGLGDRLLMFDNTGAASLELLRFRPWLANAPGFESTLRESVRRLSSFKHASFAQARSLQRLEGDDGLALISTHVEGKRLSDMFRRTHHHDGMHPGFATWLIRQLTSALGDFHAHADAAHGALSADRIVLTPDRSLVIIEHVLGAALNDRRFSPERLWHDVGIIVPPAGDEPPRLDKRGDIVQLGLVALSVLLGRRVTPEEYPRNLERLLDEFAETSGKRSPTLVGPLRRWLIEALDPSAGFETALEAGDSLTLLGHPGEHLALGAPPIIQQLQVVPPKPAIVAERTPVSTVRAPEPAVQTVPVKPTSEPEAQVVNMAFSSSAGHAESLTASAPEFFASAPTTRRRFSLVRNIAIGFAAFAVLEGIVIGQLLTRTRTTPAAAAPDQPLIIESPVPGDRVFIDGREVGVTPYQLDGGSASHAIRVVARQSAPPATAPASAPAPAPAPAAADARAAAAIAAAAQRQHSGGFRLTTPIELQVLEGERVLGSSADGPIVASAGVHQLDFINAAIGFRSRQTVTIKAGEIIPLTVKPPDGRVSINAQPWAQVWIDGNPVGETPLANLPVSAGEHEIVFRHPQLGERRETTMVKSGVQTRISTTLSK